MSRHVRVSHLLMSSCLMTYGALPNVCNNNNDDDYIMVLHILSVHLLQKHDFSYFQNNLLMLFSIYVLLSQFVVLFYYYFCCDCVTDHTHEH